MLLLLLHIMNADHSIHPGHPSPLTLLRAALIQVAGTIFLLPTLGDAPMDAVVDVLFSLAPLPVPSPPSPDVMTSRPQYVFKLEKRLIRSKIRSLPPLNVCI